MLLIVPRAQVEDGDDDGPDDGEVGHDTLVVLRYVWARDASDRRVQLIPQREEGEAPLRVRLASGGHNGGIGQEEAQIIAQVAKRVALVEHPRKAHEELRKLHAHRPEDVVVHELVVGHAVYHPLREDTIHGPHDHEQDEDHRELCILPR